LGRLDNKRLAFANGISLAFGDCFAIGFSHPNTICFPASILFTGCNPFRDGASGFVANGVANTGPLASSISFAINTLIKPGFALD